MRTKEGQRSRSFHDRSKNLIGKCRKLHEIYGARVVIFIIEDDTSFRYQSEEGMLPFKKALSFNESEKGILPSKNSFNPDNKTMDKHNFRFNYEIETLSFDKSLEISNNNNV